MSETTQYLAIDQVAAQLKTTELNVLMHIKRGLLNGQEQDGRWVIAADSLQAFLASPGHKKSDVIVCKSHGCGSGCGSCG